MLLMERQITPTRKAVFTRLLHKGPGCRPTLGP